MRRNRLLLGIVLPVLLCSSLAASVDAASVWSRMYGGAGDEYAYSLVSTSDGGYALAGWTDSFGAGGADFWLVKTDASGNMLWNNTYGGTGNDRVRSLIATSDGGYVMAGGQSFVAGKAYVWLVKVNSNGIMEWNRTYGGIGEDVATSLVATSDEGYAIAGYTNADSNGIVFPDKRFLLVVKTDTLGNMEWSKTYEETGNGPGWSIIAASDGGYAVAGRARSPGDGSSDFCLVKTDTAGNIQWKRTYGGAGSDYAFSLTAASDGGYAIVGRRGSYGTGGDPYPLKGVLLVKTDSNGIMQWNQTYGETGVDNVNCIVATPDGGYIMAGYTRSLGDATINSWLVKIDAAGNLQWNRTIDEVGGTTWNEACSLVAAPDGGYAMAGYTTFYNDSKAFAWAVKTDEFGIVPEYSSWLVPALMLVTTAFIVINKRRRAPHTRWRQS